MSAGTMKNINDAVIRKTHTNATCVNIFISFSVLYCFIIAIHFHNSHYMPYLQGFNACIY